MYYIIHANTPNLELPVLMFVFKPNLEFSNVDRMGFFLKLIYQSCVGGMVEEQFESLYIINNSSKERLKLLSQDMYLK